MYGDSAALPMREDATPQPISPYGVTKLAAEQLCLLYHVNYGLPTVALRYFTVYGPRQRPDMGFRRFLAASMRNEPLPLYGDGRQTRDFTFVADAVSATVTAAVTRHARGCLQYWWGIASRATRGVRAHRAYYGPAAAGRAAGVADAAICATPTRTHAGHVTIWDSPRP